MDGTKTLGFTINITVKDINQTLALMNEDVITTEEEIAKYKDLSFNLSDFGDSEQEAKLGMCALLITAKAEKEKTEKEAE